MSELAARSSGYFEMGIVWGQVRPNLVSTLAHFRVRVRFALVQQRLSKFAILIAQGSIEDASHNSDAIQADRLLFVVKEFMDPWESLRSSEAPKQKHRTARIR